MEYLQTTYFFLLNHAAELGIKILEQLYLVGVSIVAAIVLGVPIGVWAARNDRLRNVVLGIASILQTIPSLALLAFLLPFFGIGAKPAIIALALYALLPIIQNTLSGLSHISRDTIEAADALGFTRLQRLWIIELPLALPIIVAGIRTATTISMGIATLAAFIGAGGLGDFINRGLALNNSAYLLLGAIPAALLALLLDFIVRQIEIALQKGKRIQHKKSYFVFSLLLLFLSASLLFYLVPTFWLPNKSDVIRIASKNFTEQFILSEMLAELIENKTSLRVERDFNLGTTDIVQQAMQNGQIDMYPEYTGTAYLTVLHQPYTGLNSTQIYQIVKQMYLDNYRIIWLNPFGFNNTQALAVRADFAKHYHLNTISDLISLAPRLTIAGPTEFIQRPDALPGLIKTYHLHFASIQELAPNLEYEAIKNKRVDVIMAFSTDGRIPAYHLVLLRDDKHLFPPYDCAPLIRFSVLQKYPQLNNILNLLSQQIDDQTMQQLNYEVDVEKLSPRAVAHEFLVRKKFLPT